MIINICDICDQPVKQKGNLICLVSAEDPKSQGDLYSVCDSCFLLIKRVLNAKRKEAEQILEDLEKQYRLPEKKHLVIKKKGHK
jgi:hypothetical protein